MSFQILHQVPLMKKNYESTGDLDNDNDDVQYDFRPDMQEE